MGSWFLTCAIILAAYLVFFSAANLLTTEMRRAAKQNPYSWLFDNLKGALFMVFIAPVWIALMFIFGLSLYAWLAIRTGVRWLSNLRA